MVNLFQENYFYNCALCIGNPDTPNPVILNNLPAGSGCGRVRSVAADVTNKSSKYLPPNATEVICSAGNSISRTILPSLISINSIKLLKKKKHKIN